MRKSNPHFTFTILLLCLFIPVVGWVISFVAVLRRLIKIRDMEPGRYSHLEMELKDPFNLQKPNVQKETNIVALEDALTYMDVKFRRSMLLDVLKKDMKEYTPFLRKAVNNEDTETAHYAATALNSIRRQLLLRLQQMSQQYELKQVSDAFLSKYREELMYVLQLGYLDPIMETHYRQMYVQVLIDLIVLDFPGKKEYFMQIIDASMQLHDSTLAAEYCKEMKRVFPDDEDTYFMMAKYFYAQKKGREFKNTIKSFLALKHRSFRTSRHMEYWLKGV